MFNSGHINSKYTQYIDCITTWLNDKGGGSFLLRKGAGGEFSDQSEALMSDILDTRGEPFSRR